MFFILLLDYPYISRIYNSFLQKQCITAYEKSLKATDNVAFTKEKARQYNESLSTGVSSIKDAFSPDGTSDRTYLTLLSINKDETMGTLYIPAIDLKLPIYHGTSEHVLQKGVGHLEEFLPIGGIGTHACLSAHRGLPDKTMFTNLDLLKKGDTFFINILDETLAYRIYDIRTVLPDDITPLAINEKSDLVTLITCTPYGINTHRLYVTGIRIPYKEQHETEEIPLENRWILNWYIPVTIALLIMMFIILHTFKKREESLL